MRLVLKIAVVSLLASTFVWAAPPQCQPGTLDQYIALGAQGCELAGVVYADFQYQGSSTGGAPVITAKQITVTPNTVVPSTGNFTFAAPWSVGVASSGGQSQTSTITYIGAPSSEISSGALALALGPAQVGTVGSATVTETAIDIGMLKVFESCNLETCQSEGNASLQFSNATVVSLSETVEVVATEGSTSLKSYETSLNTCVPCV
jgi:hypothetical protein